MNTKKVLCFSSADNVAVALEDLKSGDTVYLSALGCSVEVIQDIPQGHKIAISDIEAGKPVVKYDHEIGKAKSDIRCGEYVHVFNVSDAVADWSDESGRASFGMNADSKLSDEFLLDKEPDLYGYRRKNGSVGFRNHVLVVSTCVCANTFVKEVEYRDRDLICIESPTG